MMSALRFSLISLVMGLALSTTACSHEAADTGVVSNIRLGMTPRDVRERFQPGAPGTWQTALGPGDDTILEWKPGAEPDPKSKGHVVDARFEFHLAMLVAIRAVTTDPPPDTDQISTTAKTVTVRGRAAPGAGVTGITVLARDCPTHKDESESLAARAAK